TKLSQHEILVRLANIQRALVYYACPLMFDADEIYEYPDLDALMIVDVKSAPKNITQNDRHFIAFQSNSDASPVWCSEPYPGEGYRASKWIDSDSGPKPQTGEQIKTLIGRILSALDRPSTRDMWIPRSFTVLSFKK